ncbi:MAG: ATP-binding protein [Bacteroidia bacterium]
MGTVLSGMLDLGFDHWGLLTATLGPVLINIGIILFVAFALPPSRTNTSFLIFVLLLASWQLSDGLIRLSHTASTAYDWTRIDNTLMLFLAPFAILFGLRFASWHKLINPALLLITLFTLPILLTCGIMAHLDHYSIIASERWVWIINPKTDPFTISIYVWHSILGLSIIILYWAIYLFKRRDVVLHKPAFLLALGVTIPVVAGIAFEIICPLLFQIDDIPITAPMLTFFSFFAFIAITRYRLLDYSPRHQWDKIVHLTNEGLIIVNTKDEIMYANECMCRMMGYAFSEMGGKKASLLLTGETYWTDALQGITHKPGSLTGRYETRVTTKSGTKIWMLMSGSPYLDSKNKITGSIGLFTNIDDLKKVKAGLDAKIDELNAFFYRASHDLKSPAASIQGLLSLFAQGDETERSFIFSSIETCASKLMDTTDRLAQIATITQRKVEVNEIDWEEKITSLQSELCRETDSCICEKQISLESTCYSDGFLISMVLRIAFQNAIQYRGLNKKECHINVTVHPVKGGVQVELSDNGPGLPKQVQEKMFTMFCKGSNKAGIGLGLYTMKAAVEKLGGSVSLESTEGLGTTVSFFFPHAMRIVA